MISELVKLWIRRPVPSRSHSIPLVGDVLAIVDS